ncbi:MAG: hypothetical protein Q7J48_17665 [Nocardioides sp.]|nr:hypothetical protein [Nocardioides sp.]
MALGLGSAGSFGDGGRVELAGERLGRTLEAEVAHGCRLSPGAQALVDGEAVGERQAGGLAGEDRGAPLVEPAFAHQGQRVWHLPLEDLGEAEQPSPLAGRLAAGQADLLGDALPHPLRPDPGRDLGGALGLIKPHGGGGLGCGGAALEFLGLPEKVDELGVREVARTCREGGLRLAEQGQESLEHEFDSRSDGRRRRREPAGRWRKPPQGGAVEANWRVDGPASHYFLRGEAPMGGFPMDGSRIDALVTLLAVPPGGAGRWRCRSGG